MNHVSSAQGEWRIPPDTGAPSLSSLMTRERWIEVGRILLSGLIALLYGQQLVPVQVLWAAVAIGLYPLVKTGLIDLVHERKIGTEILVTVATLVAVLGGETIAGAVGPVLIEQTVRPVSAKRITAALQECSASVNSTCDNMAHNITAGV